MAKEGINEAPDTLSTLLRKKTKRTMMQLRPPPAIDMGRPNAVVGMMDEELPEMPNDGYSMSVASSTEMATTAATEFASFGSHARRFFSAVPPDEVITSVFMLDTNATFHIIHRRVPFSFQRVDLLFLPTKVLRALQA